MAEPTEPAVPVAPKNVFFSDAERFEAALAERAALYEQLGLSSELAHEYARQGVDPRKFRRAPKGVTHLRITSVKGAAFNRAGRVFRPGEPEKIAIDELPPHQLDHLLRGGDHNQLLVELVGGSGQLQQVGPGGVIVSGEQAKPVAEDLHALPIEQVRERARSYGIEPGNRMKGELVKAIEKARKERTKAGG